jgi:hypothetical protein
MELERLERQARDRGDEVRFLVGRKDRGPV